MGEKMTLERLRDRLRKAAKEAGLVLWDYQCGPLADAIDAHLTQPAQAVDAWMTDDGRVISARQKDVALRDGGASASSVAPYYIPLTAALPKDSNGAEVADGWRPIATAPKDGKEVLVAFTADGVRQVAEASWSDDEDVWVCSRDGFMLYRRNEPTHWMPLPDAPQEDTPDAAR